MNKINKINLEKQGGKSTPMLQIGCEHEEVMRDLLMNRYKFKDFKEPKELRNVIRHMAATCSPDGQRWPRSDLISRFNILFMLQSSL